MRLLGTVPHQNALISVFKSNNKISIKIEVGPFEQHYKFLETEQLYDFDSVKRFIDEEFISHSYAVFDQMNVKYQSICEQL